jgi:hypothetical protein
LLGLNRSSFYAEPATASAEDLAMMERLDRLHLDHPFLGSRKLARLLGSPEEAVNRKRVQRLMRVMGLECLFPRPRCTVTSRGHKKYPYLLKGVAIDRPGQVWSADITYVPMPAGFMYLVATFITAADPTDPNAFPLNVLIASDHAVYIGVITNIVLALLSVLVIDRATARPWISHLIFWGVNLGLLVFVTGLIVDTAELKRIGAPVMGVTLLIALAILAVRAWSATLVDAEADLDETPAKAG